ncbi:hypothetical protein LCGC14_0864890 [marine sediment metagenome]|uniref:Uncharacterized protein n=1 Tax=marine sediment metagenome TaxID=412755 RepID=A0A0F9PRS5_9ZZZZ
MAVGIRSNFDKYKKQGLTDTKAMQRAMNDQVAGIAKIRKADAAARKKKKGSWVSRLKKNVQSALKSRHSPAGKKYLARKKGY